jgi:serine/threonine protein kinase
VALGCSPPWLPPLVALQASQIVQLSHRTAAPPHPTPPLPTPPTHPTHPSYISSAHALSTYSAGAPCPFSTELQDLLNALLRCDPAIRVTMEQCLAHPWCVATQYRGISSEDDSEPSVTAPAPFKGLKKVDKRCAVRHRSMCDELTIKKTSLALSSQGGDSPARTFARLPASCTCGCLSSM